MRNRLLALGTAALSLCACDAFAQDYTYTPEAFSISELRGGILAHSVDDSGPVNILGVGNFARIQDFNVELLFNPPQSDIWRMIGNPRPHLGATINLGGLESIAYAGLTWHLPVFETGFFIEGGLGGTLTNGANSGAAYPARNLGCNLLFHEQISIGYELTDTANIMLTGEHASHAGLCPNPDNRGLTNLGVRVGFKF